MRQSLKKWAVIVGCSMCVMQITVISAKAETLNENPVHWNKFASIEEDYVEDTATPRARGDILNRGYVRLSNLDGKASIYGETLCNHVIEEIGLEMYLEKYNGNSYVSYDSWNYVEYNTYEATETFNKSVDKGFYYRLRGYHYALDDVLFESVSTTTNGLPIK